MFNRIVPILCALLLLGQQLLAYDEGTGDEAPDEDVVTSMVETAKAKELDIRTLSFPLATGRPVIDGNPEDEFWEQGESFELEYELYPTRLAPATVETEAKVAVTADHVYVLFIAHDPEIADLRSAPREHDGSKEDDYVSVIIDPTGQGAKKYEFRVNPHGSLSDVLQDTISDRWIYDWDTDWEGAAQITATGYNVEIAIPIASIRQPEGGTEESAPGIMILKRSYPRRIDRVLATFFMVDRSTVAAIDQAAAQQETVPSTELAAAAAAGLTGQTRQGETGPDRSTAGAGGASVGASGKTAAKDNLEVKLHYIYHRDEELGSEGFEQVEEHREHEAGFDAKYQIDSARSLTLTYNPNFTEVEADIARQSINNPFVQFQPEKRSFFRDANEYYNTLLPIVYTRNIISPTVGASYLHAGSSNSSGLFLVHDQRTEVIMPDTFGSEKVELDTPSASGALRYQYSKEKRTIGVLATFRGGEDDYRNAVAGIDGLINLGIDDKIRYQLMYSHSLYPQSFAEDLCEEDGCTEEAPPDPCLLGSCDTNAQVLRTNFGETLTDHALRLSYRHDGPEALSWVNYFDVAPDFRADFGFARKVDIRALNAAYGRKWYINALAGDGGKSRIRLYAIGNHHRSHVDNNELETGITGLAEFRGSHQTVFRIARRHRDTAVNRIDQASLETGDNAPLFPEDYWFWYFQVAPTVRWRLDLDGRIGEVADANNLVLGDIVELKPRIAYRFGHFELGVEGVFREFEVNNDRFYEERFMTYRLSFRRNRNISHRLLILDDLTRQNVAHPDWLDKSENERETEKSFEYTFTYNRDDVWKLLAGFKLNYEQENDLSEELTERKFYIKLEYNFSKNI